ncbi:MAG: recombination regulator RecX [Elusimicrobiota bacterium]|nr:recombination regulator RecX [Elusimicrobiota bacterium]
MDHKKNLVKLTFYDGSDVVLSADAVVAFSLKKDAEVCQDDIKKIIRHDKHNRAISESLSLLARNSYSEKMLYEKLLRKGYDEQEIKKAIERMQNLNYINDERYAQRFVNYLVSKKKGFIAIKFELQKRGLSKDIIEKALKETEINKEQFELITEIMEKKFKDIDVEDKRQVQRAVAFFLRKGFCIQDISKAFKEYKSVIL